MSRKTFNPLAMNPWKDPVIPQQRPIRKQICPECNGRGQVMKTTVWEFGLKPCPVCKGSGQIEYRAPPWSR